MKLSNFVFTTLTFACIVNILHFMCVFERLFVLQKTKRTADEIVVTKAGDDEFTHRAHTPNLPAMIITNLFYFEKNKFKTLKPA